MVAITSLLISDAYTGNQNGGTDPGLPWLQGSVGDEMWTVVSFGVSWNTLSCQMTFNSTAQTITRTDCTFANTGSFIQDGFKPGDTVTVTGTGDANSTSYTLATVTDTVLTTTGGISLTGSYATVNVYGTTPVTGIDYYDNMVGTFGPDTFISLTDAGNTRKMSVDGITSSSGATAMTYVGASKAWQNGTISITGNGTSGYVQSFTITRKFEIVPFYKVDQLQALKNALAGNAIPPDEWADVSCLGYIYQVDARYGKTKIVGQSSGVQYASRPYEFGNTGWFNEFLNGGKPEYSLVSTTYANHATSATMTTIDWAQQVDVTIVLKSANGHFTNEQAMPYVLGTPCSVNFVWLPNNSAEYSNLQTNQQQTFAHDRAMVWLGGSTIQGNQVGGNYQVLTNVKGTYNSNTQATITFTVNMATYLKTFFAGKAPGDVNYMLWVTPQQENVTSLFNTDRNAVLCDVNSMATNSDNPALLTGVTKTTSWPYPTDDVFFFNPPDIDINQQTDFKGMVGDWSYFKYDFQVPSGATIQDIGIRTQVVLYNTNIADKFANILSTADVESHVYNTSSTFDGVQCNIDIYEPTAYPGSASDPRAGRSILRTPGLDSGSALGYEMLYGFQIGYNYWNQVITGIPELLNFSTGLWSGYFTQSDFNGTNLPANTGIRMDMLITWHITDPATGITTEFNRRCAITPGDSGMNISSIPITLTTEDNLGENMNGMVANDQQTQVIFTFNAASIGGLPAPPAGYKYRSDMYVWYDDGTVQKLDSVNNYSDPNSGSLWVAPAVLNINNSTGITTVSALLDFTRNTNGIRKYRLFCNLSYQHT